MTLVAAVAEHHHTYRMTHKFYGGLAAFQARLLPLHLEGEWQEHPNGVWRHNCKDKSGLLWSESTGTIWYDGPKAQRDALKTKVAAQTPGFGHFAPANIAQGRALPSSHA
jgi:hypothetical protein